MTKAKNPEATEAVKKTPRKSVESLKGLTQEERTLKIQEAYPELSSIMDLELLHQPITYEYVRKLQQAERKPSK